MSQAKDDLMEILCSFFLKEGYTYRKAKNEFTKIINDISYHFALQFDGRGGLTMVNNIAMFVTVVDVEKAMKKILKYPRPIGIVHDVIRYSENSTTLIIPTMHSKTALDAANTMNMKALAAIAYEQKYPQERIANCAKKITELHLERIVPFFEQFKTLDSFYELFLNENPQKDDYNPLGIQIDYPAMYNKFNMLFIKLLSRKMNAKEPKITQRFPTFINDLIASNVYLENINPQTLERDIKNYQF
jgi:3-methyladenine DNA glycosylase AlkC